MNIDEWKIKHQDRRYYTHFDPKYSLSEVWNYISDSKKVSEHSFYPFIHYQLKFKKYSKKKGVKIKERDISYAAHKDRFIFQYYAYKLNQIYNSRLVHEGINENVIGYRDNLHKNNVHFAKDAIDFIKENKQSYILIGDFTGFFDNLDHKYLKTMLKNLLQVHDLPNDYYAVFKNVTRYSTWELSSLIALNKLEGNKKGIREFNKLQKALSSDVFKEQKKYCLDKNKKGFGIPQGSPISSIFSNIYMLEFDIQMKKLIVDAEAGFYMRYSDDFILILPHKQLEEFKEIYQKILSIINSKPRLVLESDKTQIFRFENKKIQSANEDILEGVENGLDSMNYLGFNFDGEQVRIKDKTISKYFYKMHRKLKTITKNGGYVRRKKADGQYEYIKSSNKNLYRDFSIKGSVVSDDNKGNFITYVKRVDKIFVNEPAIKKILNTHMQKIKKKLNKTPLRRLKRWKAR